MDDPKEQISQIEELLEELVANPEDISISGTAKKIYWAIMSNQKIEGLPYKSITAIKDLRGKTIAVARHLSSVGNVIKLIQIRFTDGTLCSILADDPRVDIGLMEDSEKAILEKEYEREGVKDGDL